MSKRDYTINSDTIRAKMVAKAMNQADLAYETGLSTSTISNILAGTSGKIPSLRKVARILKIKWADMITAKGPDWIVDNS